MHHRERYPRGNRSDARTTQWQTPSCLRQARASRSPVLRSRHRIHLRQSRAHGSRYAHARKRYLRRNGRHARAIWRDARWNLGRIRRRQRLAGGNRPGPHASRRKARRSRRNFRHRRPRHDRRIPRHFREHRRHDRTCRCIRTRNASSRCTLRRLRHYGLESSTRGMATRKHSSGRRADRRRGCSCLGRRRRPCA